MFKLFERSVTEYTKRCHVYLPREGQRSIIAATYNNGGLYLEYAAVECDMQSELFEQTITRQFDACIYRADFNHRDRKKSDWPAFVTSGYQTIKQFENDYLQFSLSGANKKNIILLIESPEVQYGIALKSVLSASFRTSQLKERLFAMHRLFLKTKDLTRSN